MMTDTPNNEHEDGPLDEADNAPEEVQEERLELADEEESLPWLESGEYEDEESGSDNGRLIGFGLLALLALALLIGLIWWLSNRSPDPELAADGSMIEAPEGDYKERPDDPGGRSFEGTGRVASAVGEGESREGRMAEGDGAANGGTQGTGNANGSGNANGNGSGTSGTASADEGVGVQVGAYSSRAGAVTGWSTLQRQTEALSGFKYRIIEGQADIGTVFRLQAVANNAGAANTLCSALKADGVACQVKR